MIHKDEFKNEYIFLRKNELQPDIAVSYHQINNNIFGWYSGIDDKSEVINSYFWVELDEYYYGALKILISKDCNEWEKNIISNEALNDYKITKPQIKILKECEDSFKEKWFDSNNKVRKIRIPKLIPTTDNDKMLIPENLNFPFLSLLSSFWDLNRKIEVSFQEN